MQYEKPEIVVLAPAVEAVKGGSKLVSNTDSNQPTIPAYEAEE